MDAPNLANQYALLAISNEVITDRLKPLGDHVSLTL